MHSKVTILFVLTIISLGECQLSGHRDEEQSLLMSGANSLQRALSVVEFLTQHQSSINTARALAGFEFFSNPVQALLGATLLGSFKIGLFIVSTLWIISSFFPGFIGGLGLASPLLFRSLTEGVSELKNFDYELVTRSLRSFPDMSFDALNVKGTECRSRAICEVGEFVASKFPTVASYMKSLGDKFSLSDEYASAMVKGMSEMNCGRIYASCTSSPLRKFTMPLSFF